jgi:hypothetical protein
VSELLQIADELANELRRLPCRYTDPAECPKCVALAKLDAFKQIVQVPGGPQCSHEYAREEGRCLGCGEVVR